MKTHGERAHETSDIAAIRRDLINLINQLSLEELLQARVAITRIRLARLQVQLAAYEESAATGSTAESVGPPPVRHRQPTMN